MSDHPGLTAREKKLLERARRGRRVPRWAMPVGLACTGLAAAGGIGMMFAGGVRFGGLIVVCVGMMAAHLFGQEEIEQWKMLVRKLDGGAGLLDKLETGGGPDKPDAKG